MPADGGASADLASTLSSRGDLDDEGFQSLRRKFDLPSSAVVALSLGFILPILLIVIAKHGGVG